MILKVGTMGVEKLHQALIEAGEQVDAEELRTAAYGPSTEAAVRDFQSHHVGPDGRSLVIDGAVGVLTQWALEHPNAGPARFTCPGWRFDANECSSEARPALLAAVGEIGRFEVPDGSNQIAGNRYGNGSQPWCAYFLSWCYSHCSGGSPFGELASAYKIREWGASRGRIVAAADPGDIGVILRGDGHGHVFMVIGHVLGDPGYVWTVAGNESNAVRGGKRALAGLAAIVRPIPF